MKQKQNRKKNRSRARGRGLIFFSRRNILVAAPLALLVLLALWKWDRDSYVWTAFGGSPRDSFGEKVAPAGDVNGDGFADVAVWAPRNSDYAGRVYVFLGSKRGLARSPAWSVKGEEKNDQYGHSFGTVGDVNGDGFGDFIAAAQGYDGPGAVDAGKAYLYLGSSKGLSAEAVWTQTGHVPRELFGDCSGRAGDVNQDGLSDAIIGGYGYGSLKGRAYLYLGSREGGFLKQAAWTAQGESPNDWYGYSVASAGDVNRDGWADVVIGAKQVRKGLHLNVGKVYVYHGSKEGLSPAPSWTASGENAFDLFGWRAVSAGDVNGDGFDDLVTCSYMYDQPFTEAGKVYVFHGSPSGLSPSPSWTRTGERAAAFFGISIASGDFNKDGFSDVLVGAPNDQRQFGKVHLFLGSKQGLADVPVWTGIGETSGGRMGSYVANAGDVNGDGFPDVIAGAPYDPEKGEQSGKAYLFYGNNTGKLRTYP